MASKGRYTRTKDEKGRVYLPKPIKDNFDSRGIKKLMVLDYKTNVRYYTLSGWRRVEDHEDDHALLAGAKKNTIQKAGRIRLPKNSPLSDPEVKKVTVEFFDDFLKVTIPEKEDLAALPLSDQLQFDSLLDEKIIPIQTGSIGKSRLRHSKTPLVLVPLSEIYADDKKFQNRIKIEVDELKDSIEKLGQQVAIILRGPRPYTIVSGHRRFEALTQLNKKTALAIVYPYLDDKKAYAISLTDNVNRKSLSPYEHSKALAAMKQYGFSVIELTELLGKGRRSVENYLRVWNEGSDELKNALLEGSITFSAAVQAVSKNLSPKQIMGKSIRNIISENDPEISRYKGPIYFKEFASGKLTLKLKFDRKEHDIDNVISDLEEILGKLKDKREELGSPEQDKIIKSNKGAL